MSFKPYPKYKESGVEWLGRVPEHWTIAPLKAVASHNNDVLPEDTAPDQEITYVDISGVEAGRGIVGSDTMTFSAAPSRARRRVRHGDVIVSTVRTYLRAIAPIADPQDNLIVSTGFAVIRPREMLSTGYAGYLLSAGYFIEQVIARSIGVSYPAINASDLVAIHTPVPPLEEQLTIAAFLDHETAKTDALIVEQQRLIELLQEKRQAVISHAVTKGLNPDAPMKDSGIEWLGEVPEHWITLPSRRLFCQRNESAEATDKQVTASQKHGIVFQADFVEMEGRRVVETITGTHTLRRCYPNDFVISLRSFQGGIEWCRIQGSITFHYVVLTPLKCVYEPFFAHLFKSEAYIQALRSTTNLIRDGQDLRYSHFVQVPLPVVPLEEQRAIAAFLDASVTKFDALVVEASKFITLLQERRSALISAAVTGQIDVRNFSGEGAAA